MQEKPYQVILQSVLKSQIYLNYAYLQLFQRRKSPFIFFLLNVFEHKIEVIMSWQICREVLNAYMDPVYQTATAFWNLKTGILQAGFPMQSWMNLFVVGTLKQFSFYEQTMLS